ncbi:MAG: DUF4435 domain-containing protein [Propionibacteriaceae bacterium]|jgi:hypothetical protein|nr:DUF4435 domain-containing protein [Propionibacteriaceae bacterium]
MREYLNSDRQFDEIELLVRSGNLPVLVLEGADDRSLIEEHWENSRLVVAVGGKREVLKIADKVTKQGLSGVYFLIDRDYDTFSSGVSEYPENVFCSDNHDIFMDLVYGDPNIIIKVIKRQINKADRKQVIPEGMESEKVRDKAISNAGYLGIIRSVNQDYNFGLNCKGFSFFHYKNEEIDFSTVLNGVLRCSGCDEVKEDSVREAAGFKFTKLTHYSCYISDHDFLSALSWLLKKYSVNLKPEALRDQFIMGVTCDSIKSTKWYSEIFTLCKTGEYMGFSCR